MGLVEFSWTSLVLIASALLFGIVNTQDPQNFFFSSPPLSQGRFVPSTFPNTRQQQSSFHGGTRNSLASPSGSFQEQLLFIENDDSSQGAVPHQQSSSHLQSGYSPFASAQFPLHTTRNPDYYDISPRPFGMPGSQSFTRSKAIRPSSLGSSGFIPQTVHQPRTNVPHQQTQFLAHFNEPNPISIEKNPYNGATLTSTTSANRLSGGRPFGPSGSNSGYTRNRPSQQSSTSYDSVGAPAHTQPQQQLPFRNTRNRFQPSGERTTTTKTTSSTSTTKKPVSRYNRFGSGRQQSSAAASLSSSESVSGLRKQSAVNSLQSLSAVSAPAFGGTSAAQRTRYHSGHGLSSTSSKSNKIKLDSASGSGASHRPVIISREINAPVHLAMNRPFAGNAGGIPINYNGNDKHKAGAASTLNATASSTISIGSGEERDQFEEEIREQNYVGSGPSTSVEVPGQHPTRVFEKLGLHEAGAMPSSTVTPQIVPTDSAHEVGEEHTVILTSNFFLPEVAAASAASVSPTQTDESIENSSSSEEQEDDAEDVPLPDGTTHRSPEYEYEYAEEDVTKDATTMLTTANFEESTTEHTTITDGSEGEKITTDVTFTTAQNKETTTVAKISEGSAFASETQSTSSASTTKVENVSTHKDQEDPQNSNESSAEYDEDEDEDDDYEDEDGDGSGSSSESGSGSGGGFTENTNISTAKPTKHIPANEIIDRQVVSVVTTKSVVNGSTAYPHPITPRTTTLSSQEEDIYMENKVNPATEDDGESAEDQSVNNATKGYVVIASIQTSRSINGARFLPFPAIEQEETKQTLSELERKIHGQKSHPSKSQQKNKTFSADQTGDTSSEKLSSNEDLQTTAITVADSEEISSTTSEKSPTPSSSTESIIDKLDRVQSELSSGLLSGKFPIISEMDVSTQATSSTSGSKFVPNIRKFMPKTTPKVKIHIEDLAMDDLTGLLPPGFKPRPSFKNRKITTTTTRTPEHLEHKEATSHDTRKPARNSTISRSFKNSPVVAQDVALAGLLPKGYRPPLTTSEAPQQKSANSSSNSPTDIKDIFSKIRFEENLEKLLPNDYKEKVVPTTKSSTPKPAVTIVDDISKFLPPGFKLPPSRTTTTRKPATTAVDKNRKIPADSSGTIDISKLLPKNFKPDGELNEEDDLFKKIELKDVSALLPPGFKPNNQSTIEATTSTSQSISTTESNSSYKVVFPKGIHKRPGQRLTTAKPANSGEGPFSPQIVIKKGPPTRATTEFTGWPTPSTTPISIEKLLEQSRMATFNFDDLLPSTPTVTTTSTTTTTTPEPPKPTKPGHCQSECDLAGTIKIIDGVAWKPELLDHNTAEWKNLAHEVEAQLNEVYNHATQLSKWYKKVRIDSFSKGSVLVDYFVELKNVSEDVNTQEIKKLFHQALTQPPLPVLPLKPEIENETDSDDDDVGGHFKEGKGEKLVKETYLLGRFVVDPMSTDFIVIPKSLSPTIEFAEEDRLLPQWAMVVIVIGVGSLCFVVIFGVTVLLNRQKRAKKTPIPLTADMLNELKINHMGGADNYGVDDFYNIDDAWNDTKQPIKPKRFTNSVHGSSASNIYDSWRSTRHGDYHYDQQHYPHSHKGGEHLQHQHQQQQLQHQHQQSYAPDAFSDAHQMYTYNHPGRSRYHRDYDPDF